MTEVSGTILNFISDRLVTALDRSAYRVLRFVKYLSMFAMSLLFITHGNFAVYEGITVSTMPEDFLAICRDVPFAVVMILLWTADKAVEGIYARHISGFAEKKIKSYAFMGTAKDIIRVTFVICYGVYALNAVLMALSRKEMRLFHMFVGFLSFLVLVVELMCNLYEMNTKFARELFVVKSRYYDINGKSINRDARVSYYGREHSVNQRGEKWFLLPEGGQKFFKEADEISLEKAVADVNARVTVVG